MAPTSTHHRPCPRFLDLFTGAHILRTDTWISLVTTCAQCQARYGLGPRGVPAPLAIAQHGLLPARGTNPSALSNDKIFGAQHLQGRLHPLPLHLACFRTYASTRLLPVAPQGSILGSWRTITQAGFPPARTRGLARPHWPLFPSFSRLLFPGRPRPCRSRLAREPSQLLVWPLLRPTMTHARTDYGLRATAWTTAPTPSWNGPS